MSNSLSFCCLFLSLSLVLQLNPATTHILPIERTSSSFFQTRLLPAINSPPCLLLKSSIPLNPSLPPPPTRCKPMCLAFWCKTQLALPGLFRQRALFSLGSFAKKTHKFEDLTNRDHPIADVASNLPLPSACPPQSTCPICPPS